MLTYTRYASTAQPHSGPTLLYQPHAWYYQVAIRGAVGCVVVTEQIRAQLTNPEAKVVPYGQMRSVSEGWVGGKMYMGKIGRYEAAMKEKEADGGGSLP